MAYVDYNLPLYRTGFRPYGLTNTWSATQLNGMGQVRPFTERGGWRLGAVPAHWNWQRSFSPRFLRSGMGQALPGCDPTDPLGSCYDPLVPVTPSPPSGLPGENCQDSLGRYVMCGDPSCVTGGCVTVDCPAGQVNAGGYCIAATIATPASPAPGTYGLAPGPSPRVPASQSMFPPTAGSSTIPAKVNCQSGYGVNAQGFCAPTFWTEIQPYMPLLLVVIGVVALSGSRR